MTYSQKWLWPIVKSNYNIESKVTMNSDYDIYSKVTMT